MRCSINMTDIAAAAAAFDNHNDQTIIGFTTLKLGNFTFMHIHRQSSICM